MNSTTCTLNPIRRMAALILRMQAAFPECSLSLSLLWQWAMEQLGLQRHWGSEVRAIDDPLEAAIAKVEAAIPTIKAALANDTARQRREVMTAIHAVLLAAKETHRRTEALAKEMSENK